MESSREVCARATLLGLLLGRCASVGGPLYLRKLSVILSDLTAATDNSVVSVTYTLVSPVLRILRMGHRQLVTA